MRKSRLRQKKSQQRWRWIGYSFVYLVTLGAVGACAYAGYNHLLRNEKYQVKYVLLQGTSPFNYKEVQESVRLFSGQNIFLADLAAIQAAVSKHPWVEDVVVRRELPDRIRVQVTERAVGGLLQADNRLWVLARDGRVLGPVSQDMGLLDYPIFTGLDFNNRAGLARAIAMSEQIRETSLLFWSELDHLDFSQSNNVVASLNHFKAPINLGSQVVVENLENFLSIVAHLEESYPQIAYVELGFPGQVAVMPVKAGT
ncbi:MAG: FtsQ-type POTRA domain-containing protein [Acidobacteria bacterium]|nr:FtsQ-type POTRA domain-containing protein [Acidobacteriota bacterium]MCB9396575.1 FtsQ-type POTRA domain-containing protein [Acidobacteriota bacterium]